MPVIPQYNADGPAQAQGPVLEQDGRNRLDTGSQLSALGNFANRVAGQTAPLPGTDPNQGQSAFAAVQQVGQGVSSIGQAIFDIREREAEARNYVDTQQAQTAMDQEAGEFEKWKATNPDPRTWEKAWSDRSAAFSSGYFEGKELSPKAQEAIKTRMAAFNQRQAVNVGVSAIKETTKQARESVMADYHRAIDSGNVDAAKGLSEYAFKQGWIGEDDSVRMQINAEDAVESKQLEQVFTEADTLVTQGRIDEGIDKIKSAEGLPSWEKENKIAKIEAYKGVQAEATSILDRGYGDEGPLPALRDIDARNEDGEFLNYPRLKGKERAKVKAELASLHIEEEQSVFSEIETNLGVSMDSIEKIEAHVKGSLGRELSDLEKRGYESKLSGFEVRDAKLMQSLQTKVGGYEPNADPYQLSGSSIIREVEAVTDPGPERDKLIEQMQKRMSGEPLSPGEEAVKQKRAQHNALIDAAATYKIPADRIKTVKKNGETLFVDTGRIPAQGSPSYYQNEGNLIGQGSFEGTVINISQEDRINLEKKQKSGGFVEDLLLKDKELKEGARQLDEFQSAIDNGEVKTREEMDMKYNQITGQERQQSARMILGGDSSLFPSGLIPSSPSSEEDLDAWLTGY